MRTNLLHAIEHPFRFLLRGYKDLDFYVSDKFFSSQELFPVIYHRDVLVQRDDGAEAVIGLPHFVIKESRIFTEEELSDILGSIRRKLGLYYQVEV